MIQEWFKELLIDGIISNLSGTFDTVNTKVGEIAGEVGMTPAGWNGGIFNMIRGLSETVIVPIAGIILTFVMCYELIQLIVEKNNLHDFDTWLFWKWIFKTFCAVLIVTNTWNIVMAVFDMAQSVVNQSAGVIISDAGIDISGVVGNLETALADWSIGSLLGLWFQSIFVGLCSHILTIAIFLVIYGRMIEVYLTVSVGPIPFATMANREWGQTGQNYLKSLLALGFQAFLIMVCVGIYAVLVQNIAVGDDITVAIWECLGYEQTHDYDEYHYDLDEIEHDPYVLLSILSALHEGTFTIDQVQGDLQMLFDRQYILTETVEVERRYYIETNTWTDEEGNTHTESYRVYYDYYICTVKLENFDLSHLPVYMMDQETLSMYAVYMSTLGNRPDLFPSSGYVPKYVTNPPAKYKIPAEYLSDERFATLITEAEKYLGFPYVWGGSSPSTSFDCSGFVSYVLTSSGLCDTGRLGAQGLYNISTPVSEPRPGDLVFFVGTYDTPGVSHVGFYVGDGMLLHCGDPIQYTSLNTNYWQSHLYAYGRPPYN